tara:strand:- start:52570 stop:52932 length:363 start_codon:yes stop_codon:yes gene_type:complete
MISVKTKLIQLEKDLHSDEVRSSTSKLAQMLHNDFKEITQSGTTYTKKEALEGLSISAEVDIKAFNFDVTLISEYIAQVMYETETINLKRNITKNALRSSLWKFEGDRWQMLFHQGTQKK